MPRIGFLVFAFVLAACSSRSGSNAPVASVAPATAVAAASSPGTTTSSPVPTSSVAAAPSTVAPITTARTKNPIVLVHGVGGFFFRDVATRLRARGNDVLDVRLAPIQTIDHRSRELVAQVLAAYPLATTRVNLIGHSMGGLDARAAISRLGLASRVVSLTTIATPHRGSPIADAAATLTLPPAVDLALKALGMDLGQVHDLTTANLVNVFNPTTPDMPGVFYQSWAGVADPQGVVGGRLSPALLPCWSHLAARHGANDGLVPVSVASWGLWRGTVPSDHLGQVGWGTGGFDHLKFFDDLVADLALRGL